MCARRCMHASGFTMRLGIHNYSFFLIYFLNFFLPRMEAGPPGGALNILLSIYLDPFIFFEPPI